MPRFMMEREREIVRQCVKREPVFNCLRNARLQPERYELQSRRTICLYGCGETGVGSQLRKGGFRVVVERKKLTISRLPLDVCSPSFGAPRDRSYKYYLLKNKVRGTSARQISFNK
ncbi:hypothetical protein Tco_0964853 [Tanacetum coccineum]